MIQLSLSEEYRNEKLARIHRLNDNLDKLVNGVHFQLSTHTKVVNVAEHYKRMRDHAEMIHDALKEKLQETSVCGCNVCDIPLTEGLCFTDYYHWVLAPLRESSAADEIYEYWKTQ